MGKKYQRKLARLDASYAKDEERADMRHMMTTQWMRRKVVTAQNGGTSSRY